MIHGRFITFEGPEGGGKSTQARRLAERLKSEGYGLVTTREPGGTRTGEAIRNIVQHDSTNENIYAETEVLLFASSRAQLVNQVIKPELERGNWVVSDRFYDSSVAYQGYGRGFDPRLIKSISLFAVGQCIPDLTFLLDIEVIEGFRRLRARVNQSGQIGNRDRMEREDQEFHERVRQGYLAIAKKEPERIIVLDGLKDEETISKIVYDLVYSKFIKNS